MLSCVACAVACPARPARARQGRPSNDPRTLFAAVVTAVHAPVNVSREAGAQEEGAIAIDPANPNRLFVGANEQGSSIFAAVSGNAGATWNVFKHPSREFSSGINEFMFFP